MAWRYRSNAERVWPREFNTAPPSYVLKIPATLLR